MIKEKRRQWYAIRKRFRTLPKMRIVTAIRQWRIVPLNMKRMRGLLYEDEQDGWKFDIYLREKLTHELLDKANVIFPCTFFPWFDCPCRPRIPHCWGLRDNTQTHHTPYDSSVWVIGPSQRTLPENTQHSQGTHIYDPEGIRTRNPSKRAVVDPRPRPHGLRDRRHKPQAL